jgi:hypothetical protein
MGHPFVVENKPCNYSDLIILAIVLSGKTVEEMLQPPTLLDRIHAKLMLYIKGYFGMAIILLRKHCEECGNMPKVWEKESKHKGRGVPWESNVVSCLAMNGIPLEQVMTMPFGQAMWLYCTWNISQGADVDLMSAEDERIMEELLSR